MQNAAAPVNRRRAKVRDVTSGEIPAAPGASLTAVPEPRSHSSSRSRSRPPTDHRSRAHTESASRAERKERTRQTLLDVTLRLIADRSLASISLREVARDAGIVPTAFYRHFESMDALGVELVDESMRPLRQLVRDARRGRSESTDIIKGTVAILVEQVRAHPAEFQFLTRERYGGIAAVRRAIDTELRLFTSELTVDLARLTAGLAWTAEDLEMTADLMVSAMLAIVMDLLEVDERRRSVEDPRITATAERQLRLIAIGMAHWRSSPG